MNEDSIKKEELELMVNNNLSIAQISKATKKAKTTIRYWLKKYSLKTINTSRKTWTDQQMIDAISSSTTYSDVLRKLNLVVGAGNYETVKKAVKRLNINISHFLGYGYNRKPVYPKTIAEVMVRNSTYNRCHLKNRLLKTGLIKNECSICGQLPTWNNANLVMVLDHINGINDDHRLENLRLLCPNCNSQQPTFSGKNIKKKQ